MARKKGTLNKRTQGMIDLMERLNCSPEEVLAKITMGEVSQKRNPFLSDLDVVMADMEAQGREVPTPEEWKAIVDSAAKNCQYAIPNVDQIINAAKTLLPYLRPQLKSVDMQLEGGMTMNGVLMAPGLAAAGSWTEHSAAQQEALQKDLAEKAANDDALKTDEDED